jgi:hypothetical protein
MADYRIIGSQQPKELVLIQEREPRGKEVRLCGGLESGD